MQSKQTYRLFQIPWWSIPFQIVCGFAFMYFLVPEALNTVTDILLTVLYSFLVGTPILKGYEYIEYRMEIQLPWLKAPVKRMVYTILLQASFLSLVLIVFLFVLHGINNAFDPKTILINFRTAALPGIGFSILATFVANSVLFFKNWKNAAVHEEFLKREKLALEYETLKSQINPHFLFNSFTALSSLVYKDQDKAVEFIREMSNVYRYILEQKEKDMVAVKQELDFIRAVIYLYTIRHGENLVVNINVDAADNEFILPISLQMVLENAIKHNEISVQKPLTVDIFRESDNIVVRNNLQPRQTLPHSSSIGLPNISNRYMLLASKDVSVVKTSTDFIVKLPILKLIENESTYR